MKGNTVLILVIVGAGIVALIAYESYVQSQNSLGNQVGKALGGALTSLL